MILKLKYYLAKIQVNRNKKISIKIALNLLCLLRGGEKKQAEQTDEIPCHWIWFLINIVRRASSNYGYGNPKQRWRYANVFQLQSSNRIGPCLFIQILS